MRATDNRYYTVADVAQLLQVSPSTVWRWIAAGRLKARRLGPKTVRVAQDDLDRLLAPASTIRQTVGMTIEQIKAMLAQPPTAAELARRQEAIRRTLEHRKDFVVTPLTTADLIHQAREEEYESYGRPC